MLCLKAHSKPGAELRLSEAPSLQAEALPLAIRAQGALDGDRGPTSGSAGTAG